MGCSSRIPFRRGVRLHLGEGKRWVASVATLHLAFGSEKGKEKTEQDELNKLCEAIDLIV